MAEVQPDNDLPSIASMQRQYDRKLTSLHNTNDITTELLRRDAEALDARKQSFIQKYRASCAVSANATGAVASEGTDFLPSSNRAEAQRPSKTQAGRQDAPRLPDQRTVSERPGDTQEDPQVISDTNISSPYAGSQSSDDGQPDGAPEHRTPAARMPSSPPTANRNRHSLNTAARAKKTTVINFSTSGPLNQGALPSNTAGPKSARGSQPLEKRLVEQKGSPGKEICADQQPQPESEEENLASTSHRSGTLSKPASRPQDSDRRVLPSNADSRKFAPLSPPQSAPQSLLHQSTQNKELASAPSPPPSASSVSQIPQQNLANPLSHAGISLAKPLQARRPFPTAPQPRENERLVPGSGPDSRKTAHLPPPQPSTGLPQTHSLKSTSDKRPASAPNARSSAASIPVIPQQPAQARAASGRVLPAAERPVPGSSPDGRKSAHLPPPQPSIELPQTHSLKGTPDKRPASAPDARPSATNVRSILQQPAQPRAATGHLLPATPAPGRSPATPANIHFNAPASSQDDQQRLPTIPVASKGNEASTSRRTYESTKSLARKPLPPKDDQQRPPTTSVAAKVDKASTSRRANESDKAPARKPSSPKDALPLFDQGLAEKGDSAGYAPPTALKYNAKMSPETAVSDSPDPLFPPYDPHLAKGSTLSKQVTLTQEGIPTAPARIASPAKEHNTRSHGLATQRPTGSLRRQSSQDDQAKAIQQNVNPQLSPATPLPQGRYKSGLDLYRPAVDEAIDTAKESFSVVRGWFEKGDWRKGREGTKKKKTDDGRV